MDMAHDHMPPVEAECPFEVGQTVDAVPFVADNGRRVPGMAGLVVTSVRFEPCRSIPSYWRITAEGAGGRREGATSFFAAAA